MDIIHIPASLVLGCNNPVAVNALSDFIEETTGHPLDLMQSGYSIGVADDDGDGVTDVHNENSYSHGYGDGFGYGFCYGNGYGGGDGDGYGDHVGFEDGNGYGSGNDYGCFYGDEYGGGEGIGDERFKGYWEWKS